LKDDDDDDDDGDGGGGGGDDKFFVLVSHFPSIKTPTLPAPSSRS